MMANKTVLLVASVVVTVVNDNGVILRGIYANRNEFKAGQNAN